MGVESFESVTDSVNIRNVADAIINPATEDTLQAFLGDFLAANPSAKRDYGNERYTSPGVSSTWTGTFKDISNFGQALVLIVSDQPLDSAQLEWSADGINPVSGTLLDAAQTLTHIDPVSPSPYHIYFNFILDLRLEKYYRVKVVTTSTAPTTFQSFSLLSQNQFNGSYAALTAGLNAQNQYLLTRSVLAGIRTSNGAFENQPISEHRRDTVNEQVTPLTNGAPVTFTADNTTDLIHVIGHGLLVDQPIWLTSTGTLPAGLSTSTLYYVSAPVTTDDFKISTTRSTAFGHTYVNFTDNGTGIHSYIVPGEFTGSYTRISDFEHFEIIYLSLGTTSIGLVEKIWSSDGVNELVPPPSEPILTSRSAITNNPLQGFSIYYDINEGRNTAPFYKLHVINGPVSQSATPTWASVTWLMKTPYNGNFGLLTAPLNQLSRALLVRAILSGTRPDGTFGNVAISSRGSAFVRQEGVEITPSGAQYSQGFIPYIRHDFGIEEGLHHTSRLFNLNPSGGTANNDQINGGTVFATDSAPGSICHFRSDKQALYSQSPGHGVQLDMTIFQEPASVAISGDAYVEWGLCDADTLNNGFGYGRDATGLYVWMKKNSIYTFKIYQSAWNVDKCDGTPNSKFIRNVAGTQTPETLSFDKNNLYRIQSEFLYAAEQTFKVKAPSGIHIETHVNEYPNSATATSLRSANLYACITIHNDTTSGGVISVRSGSWSGGLYTSQNVQIGRNPNDEFTEGRGQGVFELGSTTTPLPGDTGGTDHIWRGEWFRWDDSYVKAAVAVRADQPGTIFIDFSQDENPVNGDDSSITSPSREILYDPSLGLERRHSIVQSKWVRGRFINGLAAQSVFSFVFSFLTTDPGLGMKPARSQLSKESMVGTVESITTTRTQESTDDTPEYLQDRATINIETNKRGKNQTITLIEDEIVIRPSPLGPDTNPFVLTPIAQRIDTPDITNGVGYRTVRVVNSGDFHAFIKEASDVSVTNGIPLFLGGDGVWGLPPGSQLWGVCETVSGASSSTGNINGSTGTTGALTSNDTRVSLSSIGANAFVDGFSFSFTPPNTLISSVRQGIEARKQSGQTETVVQVETRSGSITSGGTITTSAPFSAANDSFLVAYIVRNGTNTITSVFGNGLSWTAIIQNVVANGKRIDVWVGFGNGNGSTVSATQSTSTNAHISVTRYANVDPNTQIQASGTTSGTGVTVTGPSLAGTNKGYSILGVIHDVASGNPDGSYSERTDISNGTGSNTVSIYVEDKALIATSSETASATLVSSAPWAAIGLTILPKPALSPVVTLSHNYNGSPHGSTTNLTFSSTSDGVQYFDITPDFISIVPGDIALLRTIATISSIGAAALEIDQLFLEITQTSGATTRVIVVQDGVLRSSGVQ